MDQTKSNTLVPPMLIDGQLAAPEYWNRAALYGDGLFETMLWLRGETPLWPWHWQRLSRGCSRLGLSWPEEDELLAECAQLLSLSTGAGFDNAKCVIRLSLFRAQEVARGYRSGGVRRCQRLLSLHPLPPRKDALDLGQSSVRLGWQPLLGGLKHLNRLEQVLAAAECEQHGWDEAIVLDQAGRLVSAVAGNLIFRRGHSWMTPPVDRCGVAGVTRQWLLEHSPVPLPVCTLSEHQLEDIDEVWVINSVLGARRGASFNGRRLACSEDGLKLARAVNRVLDHPEPQQLVVS